MPLSGSPRPPPGLLPFRRPRVARLETVAPGAGARPGAGDSVQSGMSVSGVIAEDGLLTALRLVSRGKSTGVLTASTAYQTASLGFRDGEILYACSTLTPKLGEMLVEKGLVSPEKLDAALWVQRQDKEWRALGRVLVDVRLLSLAAVEALVEAQIVRGLDEILRWDRGTFRFEPKPLETATLILPPCRDLGQYEVKVAMVRASAAPVGGGAAA